MKWSFPAKTFLLGEYVALYGGPAIILTTTPCFEVNLSNTPEFKGVHQSSPAGRWWSMQSIFNFGLEWFDPYQGRGGLGASSAQFLGAYYASQFIQKKVITKQEILKSYIKSAYQGIGQPPSGYDVLAQSMYGCVYINHNKSLYTSSAWPFMDLGFILLHTDKKLPTHQHLQNLEILNGIDELTKIVESAHNAFKYTLSGKLIEAINAYHQQLLTMNLIAPHTILAIKQLQEKENILAVKGCGALGSDVLLLLVPMTKLVQCVQSLSDDGWILIATSDASYELSGASLG